MSCPLFIDFTRECITIAKYLPPNTYDFCETEKIYTMPILYSNSLLKAGVAPAIVIDANKKAWAVMGRSMATTLNPKVVVEMNHETPGEDCECCVTIKLFPKTKVGMKS